MVATLLLCSGVEQVVYQKKIRKTTNSLYFIDRQGLPLAMSKPIAGNHNYLYSQALKSDFLT